MSQTIFRFSIIFDDFIKFSSLSSSECFSSRPSSGLRLGHLKRRFSISEVGYVQSEYAKFNVRSIISAFLDFQKLIHRKSRLNGKFPKT